MPALMLPRMTSGRRGFSAAMLLCLSVASLGVASPARAQAFCELRDPVRQIYELLPEATSHRSVVRTVDSDSREATKSALPFSIHFNEFGRHTLYVGMDDSTPLGLVHVRSEAGRWGLVEIAWALDLDLRIRDFAFQRCRDAAREAVASPAIANQIRGRSFAELRSMLSADGSGFSGEGFRLPSGSGPEVKALTLTLLRSALKTQVVTHTAWNSDLQTIRWIARGHAAFEGAEGVERVNDPWGSPSLGRTLAHAVGETSALDRDRAVVLRVRDARDRVLGLLIETPWELGEERKRIWWAVDPAGRLLDVDAGAGTGEAAAAFAALEGFGPSDFHRCSTAVELAGKEVMLLATHHLDVDPMTSAHSKAAP